MSAEMRAAASERRTVSVMTATTTLSRSHLVIPVTTGTPESEETLETAAEKLPETLETTGTAET